MFKFFHPFLKINRREVEFERRGFACSRPEVRQRLEQIGRMFLRGYHGALEQEDPELLAADLNQIEAEHRGFAYEGAGMALTLLDGLSLSKEHRRFLSFVSGPGKSHIYLVYVGAGWAFARLPWMRRSIESRIRKLDPIVSSLAIDGYGFHENYFHWQSDLQSKILRLSEDARHAFYQGLGRSLWFIQGADVCAITKSIAAFPLAFHGDAWSGVGLGCAYAGGNSRAELEELGDNACQHRAALAQGVAFAAKARQLARNPADHTELACAVLCAMSTEQAAALCDQTFAQVQSSTHPSPYQEWRRLLQQRLTFFSQALLRDRSVDSQPPVTCSKSN